MFQCMHAQAHTQTPPHTHTHAHTHTQTPQTAKSDLAVSTRHCEGKKRSREYLEFWATGVKKNSFSCRCRLTRGQKTSTKL